MQDENNVVTIDENEGQLLMFHDPEENTDIQVKLLDETVWLTQDQIAMLFHIDQSGVSKHLKNIFTNRELDEKSNMQFLHIAKSDKPVKHYNLDVILSVGYRVNTRRGTQFRIWATGRLKEYIIKGYALDEKRLRETGQIDQLIEQVRSIRTSEQAMFRKITDIFATSKDYNSDSEEAQNFFATVQNKLHYAVNNMTAAELIIERANEDVPHMGLRIWKGKRDITKDDAVIAKNYLTPIELKLLELLGEQFMSFAEFQYTDKKEMRMADWIRKLDELLVLNEREILQNRGKVSRKEMERIIDEKLKKYRQNIKGGKLQIDTHNLNDENNR